MKVCTHVTMTRREKERKKATEICFTLAICFSPSPDSCQLILDPNTAHGSLSPAPEHPSPQQTHLSPASSPPSLQPSHPFLPLSPTSSIPHPPPAAQIWGKEAKREGITYSLLSSLSSRSSLAH